MPEELKQPIQADTTKMIPAGRVKVNWNPFNGLPTPTILARITKALRYFTVALIGIVSASDLFSGLQAKKISFGLSCFIYFTGAIDIAVGVEPEERKKVGLIIIFVLAFGQAIIS